MQTFKYRYAGRKPAYSYPKKRLGVKKLKQNQKGFTLIELLVVIAIIGLLASVVLLALNSARSKSRDAKRIADVRQLSSALELYYNDNSGYPTTLGGLLSTYIGSVPTYPTPIDSPCTASNSTYNFATAGTAVAGQWSSYNLTFCLGQTTGGMSSGPHTASPAGIQ